MSHKRWGKSGQVVLARAFFDRTGKLFSLLAALGSVHILQRVLSRSEASIREQIDQLIVPKTASIGQLRQPTEQVKLLVDALAKQPGQPVETSSQPAEQRFISLMSLPVLRTGASVREEASAIWTEAQAIRHRRNNVHA
jgi:hypothetical protein